MIRITCHCEGGQGFIEEGFGRGGAQNVGRRKRVFVLHLAPVSEVGLGVRPLDTCEVEFHTSCEVCSDFLLYRANRFLY